MPLATKVQSRERKERTVNQNRLKAMEHPVRAKALRLLVERGKMCPKEVSDTSGEELSTVSYHMKRLVELDCAEMVEVKPVRGAVAHFYIATDRHVIDTDEWELLDPFVATDLVSEFAQRVARDFMVSRKAGIVGSDRQFHITRTPQILDQQGIEEHLTAAENYRLEAAEIEAHSAQRRSRSGEPGVPVSSNILFFKMPRGTPAG